MDKNKAIELLKQALAEIPHLSELDYANQEYRLWFSKVRVILEATFRNDSKEYKVFSNSGSKLPNKLSFISGGFYNDKYIENLASHETALKSILQKYEILGIERELSYIEVPPESILREVPPKAFIVHGGRSGVLDKLCEFVEALGIKPLVVEMLPSKGMPLVDKVKKYQQEADCAIILATRGGIIDIKSGKEHPRLNVIDELSSFWEAFPEKVILLLEKGAELPSNKAGLTYEPFARQSMDRAFIAIARELTEMKILKAVKPPKEQD